jgi:hypothetical protein
MLDPTYAKNAIITLLIAIAASLNNPILALERQLPNDTLYKRIQSDHKTFFVSTVSSNVVILERDTIKSYGSDAPHYAFQGFKPFVYNEDLYTLGGYGFWRVNPYLLKFDTLKGWLPIELGSDYTPTIDPDIILRNDTLVAVGGKKLGDKIHQFVDVDKIQFIPLKNPDRSFGIPYKTLKNGTILYLDKDRILCQNNHEYYLTNFKDLVEFKLDISPRNIHVLESIDSIYLHDDYAVINNLKIPLVSLNKNYAYLIFLSTTIIIIVLATYLLRKRRLPKKSFKTRPSPLTNITEKEYALIKELLIGPKLINELFVLFSPELSPTHKTKLVRELVASINLKCHTLGYEVIESYPDPVDSRRKLFKLNDPEGLLHSAILE